MELNLWIFLAVHLVLCAVVLNRLWPNPPATEKERVPFRVWWSCFAVLLPCIGPLFALFCAHLPEPDDDL